MFNRDLSRLPILIEGTEESEKEDAPEHSLRLSKKSPREPVNYQNPFSDISPIADGSSPNLVWPELPRRV